MGRGKAAMVWFLAALLGAALVFETWQIALSRGETRLTEDAGATARARALTLSSELAKQRAVAVILAGDRDVTEALATRDPGRAEAISRKFEDLRVQTGGTVIYALNTAGLAIAASNWHDPDSFVGVSYAFRGYFTGAMAQGRAWEYALGSVSHRPGLYLSERVESAGHPVGVIVVKVEFDAIEASWRGGGIETVAVDPKGVVMLTSRPAGRFTSLAAPGADRIVIERPVEGTDWRLEMVVPLDTVRREAAAQALIAGLLLLPLGGGGLWLRARQRRRIARAEVEARYRQDLENAVATRTQALSEEIRERKEAERNLAAMQARLVQANKLAAMGQITAGVAHEVNQPLATIRLLAENAQAMLHEQPEVGSNLGLIVQMSDRIARITSELRGFARKARGDREPVSLAEAWEASLLLSASRRESDRTPVIAPRIDPGLKVIGEKVRLEQVMVNLIQNAHEALSGVERPEIRVSLTRGTRADGTAIVTLTIADNGPGLPEEVARNLFTPFLTTKREGTGLGLVISQGIMRDFGGRLWADPPVPGQGARFHMEMVAA
ncbi:sensor histidine kinase [Paenirhodobacter sp.]|uniref:sensor histidine kinase n=1 Tax=Paenirhodobacter sp. TaxID=1965326 RepID=UPI003B407C4F